MQALHENAIIGEDDPAPRRWRSRSSSRCGSRSTTLDLEAISKLWTAATQPLRLSVGYEVSLVVVDARTVHVRRAARHATRRVAVAPTMGPRLRSVDPPRASFGDELLVAVEGLPPGATFTLAREAGDPAGPPRAGR